MKIIKKISIVLVIVSLLLFSVACNNKSKSLASRVSGFEVAEQLSVEIGEYYTPIMPDVTLDGKAVKVSVSATQNGKGLFFNGDNALLVESFDDITLTYTLAEGGEKIEKVTVLKVQDTVAPYIVTNTLPSRIYRGVLFEYEKYIRIGDLSGIVSESSITVTDQNGDPIATEDGAFTLPDNSTVKEVKLDITAKDGKNNVAEKQIKLPVVSAALWNEPLDFETPDLSKISVPADTTVEGTEKDSEPVLKLTHSSDWTFATTQLKVVFKLTEDIMNYTCFDYIKLVVSAKTNCQMDILGATDSQGKAVAFNLTSDVDNKVDLIYDMDLVRESSSYVVSGSSFLMNLRLLEARHKPAAGAEGPTEPVSVEFYIYSFEFGYYEHEVRYDSPVDTTMFGIEAEEVVSASFVPETGAAQTIDLTRWLPKKGTLVLVVKKDGYSTTTVKIPLNPKQEDISNSSDNDTDVGWGNEW